MATLPHRRARRDHPAGRDKAHVVALHIGREGGMQRLDDLRARRGIHLLQDQPDRPEPREVVGQRRRGERAFNLEGLDVDLAPSARLEDARDSRAVGERGCPVRSAGAAAGRAAAARRRARPWS